MSTVMKAESAQDIVRRMESQRAQLQRQFAPEPAPAVSTATAAPMSESAMHPHEYKSLLMRLLVANPQLIRRVLLLAATTALGARYASWTMKLLGFFLASRAAAKS